MTPKINQKLEKKKKIVTYRKREEIDSKAARDGRWTFLNISYFVNLTLESCKCFT